MKFNPKDILALVSSFTKSKHFPEVLIGAGAASLVAATVTAVSATVRAKNHIDDLRKDVESEVHETDEQVDTALSKKDVVKESWRFYIPTAVLTVVGLGLIASGGIKNVKMRNALATACLTSEQAYSAYRRRTLDKIGDEAEREIHDAAKRDVTVPVQQAQAKQADIQDPQPVPFKEALTGQVIYTTRARLEWCANEFNRRMIEGSGYLALNDWYELIGLEDAGFGDEVGFNLSTGLIDLRIEPDQSSDGQMPCFLLDYYTHPQHSYDEYM